MASWNRFSRKTLGLSRFPEALRRRATRQTALREIARCFLSGAGMTFPGELARVTGLSRPDAGLGNRALVSEGYAVSPSCGVYQLAADHIALVAAKPTDTISADR